ncbi:MAG TPA: acyl-CoA-binding protein [Polyangiaceae bacterium]|jgi:carboxylesterase
MASEEEFSAAQTRVKQLKKTPASDELLELYAYFKQATLGDAQGSRPGMLDFKGRAKFDAWSARQGIGKDAAKSAYVELVQKLVTKYDD